MGQVRRAAAICIRQRRRLTGRHDVLSPYHPHPAWHCPGPLHRQAGRYFCLLARSYRHGAGAEAGRIDLATAVRRRLARRHRLHHELVHRHAGLRRCRARRRNPHRRHLGLAGIRGCRLLVPQGGNQTTRARRAAHGTRVEPSRKPSPGRDLSIASDLSQPGEVKFHRDNLASPRRGEAEANAYELRVRGVSTSIRKTLAETKTSAAGSAALAILSDDFDSGSTR
ncbi:protein of unknown function [Hyphomicrobium sp. 1Nfss2.1]